MLIKLIILLKLVNQEYYIMLLIKQTKTKKAYFKTF